MIGYAWLSKAVIFGVTATPPDASDLNSPLCRPPGGVAQVLL